MDDGCELDDLARTNAGADPAGPAGPVADSRWIVPLSRAGEVPRSVVGGKGSNLGRLRHARMPVPPGFCVTTSAFREFLDRAPRANRASSILTRIASAGFRDRSELAGQLAMELKDARIPPAVEAAILAAWRAQGEGRAYAVRSSATAEDAPEHSFAGQFDSVLNVHGCEALLAAVRRSWMSLFSPRALAYGLHAGLRLDRLNMAVIVQDMVPADVAGVAFTVDPVSGDAERLVIESTSGLGNRLVSGRVTPQTVVLARSTLHVVERRGEAADNHGSEALFREVGELALRAETLLGHPVDLEWAAVRGRVFLLQARAVTGTNEARARAADMGSGSDQASLGAELEAGSIRRALATAPAQTGSFGGSLLRRREMLSAGSGSWEDRQIWTNVNTGEVMPDVMTPVTWSMIRRFLDRLAGSCFALMGADPERAPLVGRVGGRLYFNLNTPLAALRPFQRIWSDLSRMPEALGGAQTTLFAEGLLELPDEDLPELGFRWSRYLWSFPKLVRMVLAHSPRRGDAWTARLRADNEARRGENLDGLSAAELGERLQRLLEEGLRGWDLLYLVTQAAALPVFEKACRDWLDDPDLATGYRLFSGLGGVPEADAGLALWGLAKLARAEPSVEAVVMSGWDWSTVQTRVAAGGPAGQRFLEQWDHFMVEHGHHCRGELELFNARWSETPDYILGLVRGYLRALDHTDPLANRQRLAREREQLTAQCQQRMRNPLKRWLFTRSLARAQKLAVSREEWKSQAVRLIADVRRILRALGERLAQQGVFALADDVFFLEVGEIEEVAAGRADLDVRAIVCERRAAYDRDRTLTPPPVVFGRFDPARPWDGVAAKPGGVWEGIPVFPGVVAGPARVILRADDHEQVLPGEILVAPFTDPAWTPYFVAAAAVVMDQGGILSHGSIVAREYGLPAVTNVGSATKGIRTGDWIEVDGRHGRVRRL